MVIDLTIGFPDLVISDVAVEMQTHPHGYCPSIVEHYRKLIGLSIARGFTHKVRDLFGGPKGCAHTTALLQAMAPVAIQSIWSMRSLSPTERMVDAPKKPKPAPPRSDLVWPTTSIPVTFGQTLDPCLMPSTTAKKFRRQYGQCNELRNSVNRWNLGVNGCPADVQLNLLHG